MLYPLKKTPGNTSWFVNDRFGLFIHFGLYSQLARHEWVKSRELLSNEEYQKYFEIFNPDLFDAKQWAKQAKQAGMRYAVLTTKHHEGFCLFDSKYTDYKITNTPFGRDLVKEYVEAFRAEGLKVGFYYSLLDWHHEDFTIDTYHPLRNRPNAEELNKGRDMTRYAEYMNNQITELLSNYGKIDVLWMDFTYEGYTQKGDPAWFKGKGKNDWNSERLIETARRLQPEIMINNRTGIEQDLFTPEQIEPDGFMTHPKTGEKLVWELCHTFSGSWGYHRDEMSWKNEEMLLTMLINTVSNGGNLLLNVGPDGRGRFDHRASEMLSKIGDWMYLNSRSIVGCTMAQDEFKAPFGTKLTQSQDGKRIYVHLINYPCAHLLLKGFAGKIKHAQFLHDASELRVTEGKIEHFAEEGVSKDNGLAVVYLPQVKPNVTIPVIELFLK